MNDDSAEPNPPEVQADQIALEWEKLELERYRIRQDYKKFVLGSVFVALAVAAIPPLFQLATAGLEYVKSNADRLTKRQQFRDDYIKEFVNNAINQDIELRIRFAQYFARVSTEEYREDWREYLNDLIGTRKDIREQIDKMEAQWSNERDSVEAERLARHLAWAYKEVGYVEKDRSAAGNPRAPEIVDSSTRILRGKVSTWGGPRDFGVAADEGLALLSLSDVPKFSAYFLGEQPAGTSGLARRLNPESYYIMARWNFSDTSREFLRNHLVTVVNPQTGKSAQAQPVDWGPSVVTGRVADISPGLAHFLGVNTDDEVRILIPQ